MKTITFLLLIAATVVACAAATDKPASAACTSNSECSTGACLDLAVFNSDGGCTTQGKACSKTCATDTDCATLGAKFKCFAGCGATKTCGETL